MDHLSEPILTQGDLADFAAGVHFRLYHKLGAHLGADTTRFAVWAPSASGVSVIGDFNSWDPTAHVLEPQASSGIWAGTVPEAGEGSLYKYLVTSDDGSYRVEKADPLGLRHETPPKTASVICHLAYEWGDHEWMKARGSRSGQGDPISIYEVHLGSWRRKDGGFLPYREVAEPLAEHVSGLGFTHVELLPVMEHPFYGSWGYQITGYFAPTSRYGSPQDLMFLIDLLHQAGVGVILDWVPSHFANDQHGLGYFDGTHLYEHADPRQAVHPDWDSLIFNYGRHEVRSFLISSACFWLDRYHADGLRVDGVASMLYLDYSRKEGEWIPNVYGGNENLEAIIFLGALNEEIYRSFPDTHTVAEESTAWPMVSRPTNVGGLGFGMKWDMGWMHDTLSYLARDPVHRKHHHGELTFRMLYAFGENFVLPLSHDEVVHGKGSLLAKMPGSDTERFANLRLLLAYQWALPGKKLLFQGCEIGQREEWDHETEVRWTSLAHHAHQGVERLVADLNRLYLSEPCLHDHDFDASGFSWVEGGDAEAGVLAFLRWSGSRPPVLVAFNLTPVPRHDYRLGVPRPGRWDELLNTDALIYGGAGHGNLGGVDSQPLGSHSFEQSVLLTLPPLGAVFLRAR